MAARPKTANVLAVIWLEGSLTMRRWSGVVPPRRLLPLPLMPRFLVQTVVALPPMVQGKARHFQTPLIAQGAATLTRRLLLLACLGFRDS